MFLFICYRLFPFMDLCQYITFEGAKVKKKMGPTNLFQFFSFQPADQGTRIKGRF